MNHCVPDFEMDDEYQISTRPRKSARGEEDEIMELRWQNGEVVAQSQNQRSLRKSHATEASDQPLSREIRSEEEMTPHLFMQEDEMVSWLHYPLDETPFERDLYSDLLYPTPSAPPEVRPLPPRPPVPPARRVELESESPSQRYQNQNFLNLRMKGGIESGPSNTMKPARESTVVDSNEHGNVNSSGACVAATCELTVTSSPGGSGASVSASGEPSQKPPSVTEDRKRKGREGEDSECHSEGVEFESAAAKKQAHGSTSTRRSRAAEVHNLSERRRRDRINEKMKALQELIPGCNKSDKASMLDEAIEYLKSLQMQVQMMSMGCSMVPVMFPGVQQFMPPMAMGMGMGLNMGMGMGMDMGMSRPMVPFPPVLPSSALQNPAAAAAAHLGPRFSMPAFHMPPAPGPDPSRIQATNQSDSMLNSLVSQNPNQARAPNFADPYQQYLALHHTQVPLPQNHAVGQPNTSRPSSSREVGNPENQ